MVSVNEELLFKKNEKIFLIHFRNGPQSYLQHSTRRPRARTPALRLGFSHCSLWFQSARKNGESDLPQSELKVKISKKKFLWYLGCEQNSNNREIQGEWLKKSQNDLQCDVPTGSVCPGRAYRWTDLLTLGSFLHQRSNGQGTQHFRNGPGIMKKTSFQASEIWPFFIFRCMGQCLWPRFSSHPFSANTSMQ